MKKQDLKKLAKEYDPEDVDDLLDQDEDEHGVKKMRSHSHDRKQEKIDRERRASRKLKEEIQNEVVSDSP